jgi:hypothetical protein
VGVRRFPTPRREGNFGLNNQGLRNFESVRAETEFDPMKSPGMLLYKTGLDKAVIRDNHFKAFTSCLLPSGLEANSALPYLEQIQ